jgi:phenylacetate-CoA ligase
MDLRACIAVGGSLSAEHREFIGGVLGCPVFERYSSSEMGTIAGECENHRLHLNVGSLYAEHLPVPPEDSPAFGLPRTLVLTDLFNYAQPFIRYNVEDVISIAREPCACGRTSPVVASVHGRVFDQVTSPTGEWIDPICFGNLLRNVGKIRRFQFVQCSRDSYVLRVVPESALTDKEIDSIVEQHRNLLGASAKIEVHQVKEIPPLASGKRPFVINQCNRTSASQE